MNIHFFVSTTVWLCTTIISCAHCTSRYKSLAKAPAVIELWPIMSSRKNRGWFFFKWPKKLLFHITFFTFFIELTLARDDNGSCRYCCEKKFLVDENLRAWLHSHLQCDQIGQYCWKCFMSHYLELYIDSGLSSPINSKWILEQSQVIFTKKNWNLEKSYY